MPVVGLTTKEPMSDSRRNEIFKSLREGQVRLAYWQLASSGACLMFALSRTADSPLSWNHVLWGSAVISWLVSLYFGFRHQLFSNATLRSNFQALSLSAGTHPDIPRVSPVGDIASDRILRAARSHGDRAHLTGRLQSLFLLWGVVLYTLFSVSTMVLRGRWP